MQASVRHKCLCAFDAKFNQSDEGKFASPSLEVRVFAVDVSLLSFSASSQQNSGIVTCMSSEEW